MESQDIVALASVAVLIGIIIAGCGMYKAVFENPEVVFDESPLNKNTELQLFPGEIYRYTYLLNNSSVNMTFVVLPGGECTRIRVMESANASEVCVDRWGLDESGSNASYKNPSILLFKPWMLALHENWTWNNTMYIDYNGARERITDNHYRVVRMENYSGRESYIVEIKSGSGPAEYEWVDSEKRVLLRVIGEGYEVVMAESLPQD